jgi:uncharacterized protein (TIGR03083 family)
MNVAAAYETIYQRIASLVNDDNATFDVPTCPGWKVKDVIAHLAGFFAVYENAGMKGFGPGWGDRVVEERKDRSLRECLDEWVARFRQAEEISPVALSDALAHEQDIRTAIEHPGARDDPNLVPALEMALSFVENNLKSRQAPSFGVITDGVDRTVGEGEPVATLRTTTYELFRAVQGRRTKQQVRAMDWQGDPEPILDEFFVFGPSEQVVET